MLGSDWWGSEFSPGGASIWRAQVYSCVTEYGGLSIDDLQTQTQRLVGGF